MPSRRPRSLSAAPGLAPLLLGAVPQPLGAKAFRLHNERQQHARTRCVELDESTQQAPRAHQLHARSAGGSAAAGHSSRRIPSPRQTRSYMSSCAHMYASCSRRFSSICLQGQGSRHRRSIAEARRLALRRLALALSRCAACATSRAPTPLSPAQTHRLNMSRSKPLPRSTPSQWRPGLMLYRLGGGPTPRRSHECLGTSAQRGRGRGEAGGGQEIVFVEDPAL